MPPTRPAPVLAADFTDRKVFRRLAAKLDAAQAPGVLLCHVDRYSTGEEGGIDSQVGRSTRLHSVDSDVQQYLAIPEDAFDRSRFEAGAPHGVVHLTLSDIHPSVRGDDYVGALVRRGGTLFLRLSTSSTQRQIRRPDGPDENAYTALLIALMNHTVGSLTEVRWSDDTRRAGRETPSWAAVTSRAAQLGVHLTFGTKTYDPRTDRLLLSLLGGLNETDDETRVRSVVGGRLEKLVSGACPISERQLPHGLRHVRRGDGRVLIEKNRRFVEADLEIHPHIVEALRMHADGRSYIDIGTEVLARHRVPRRGQTTAPGATYADLLDNRNGLACATQGFFTVAGHGSVTEERFYLGKLAVWETGTYPYRLRNQLRQRGAAIAGVVPTYEGPDDVTGFFDLELDWGVPLTGFRDDAERAEVIGKCRERLLAERRAPRKVEGRAAVAGDTRVLGGPFDRWAADDPRDERWQGDTTEYGVSTRVHNSGTNTYVLVHYPSSSGRDDNGRPVGLLRFTSRPGRHVAGTWSSAAWCASVAASIEALVENGLLDPAAVAAASLPDGATARSEDQARRAVLEQQLRTAQARAQEHRADAEGLELMAGRKERVGDCDAADRYDQRARQANDQAAAQASVAARIRDQLDRLSHQPRLEDRLVNLTVLAYLQAGLQRAARANGRGSHRLRQLTEEHLTDWKLRVRGDRIRWSCVLVLPLTSGDRACFPVSGDVENIRHRRGGRIASADDVARRVLADGLAIDDVAAGQDTTRRQLVVTRLMPWLVKHGVASRGAKNALLDHPLQEVRHIVHAQVTGRLEAAAQLWGPGYADHLAGIYCDPDLRWGDAACPDDMTWISQAVATVSQNTHVRIWGVPVLDLALALGVSPREVRSLVMPERRERGFTRPRFLAYADRARTRVKAIGCPHGRCRGRRQATHVVMLPEVAASGFGVLCAHCRRTPSTEAAWPTVQFPRAYLQHWTSRGPGGSLREGPQTIAARTPEAITGLGSQSA